MLATLGLVTSALAVAFTVKPAEACPIVIYCGPKYVVIASKTLTDQFSSDGVSAQTPSLSADGRYLLFMTESDLVPTDTNGPEVTDLYRKDLITGALVRVNTKADGGQANSGALQDFLSTLTMSSDGRYVTFWSDGTLR